MTKLTVDAVTEEKLCSVHEFVEIRNESGELLGYFAPAVDPAMYKGVVPPITEEELRRREKEGGGRPLADILADLEKLA